MKNKLALIFFVYSISASNIVVAKDNLEELTEHLRYLTERDKILSLNIANADTPKYKPKDLSGYDKDPTENIKFSTTNPMHMSLDGDSNYQVVEAEILEQKPNGNAVTLEHEMHKKSENAAKLQEMANLYSKTRGMMKTAIMGHK